MVFGGYQREKVTFHCPESNVHRTGFYCLFPACRNWMYLASTAQLIFAVFSLMDKGGFIVINMSSCPERKWYLRMKVAAIVIASGLSFSKRGSYK